MLHPYINCIYYFFQIYIPSGPLPVVPADEEDISEEDELELEEEDEPRSESPVSDQSDLSSSKNRYILNISIKLLWVYEW